MWKLTLQVLSGALIGLALVLGASAVASGGITSQITDSSTYDRYPAISGSNVVWQHCDDGTGSGCSGGDYEIYFWDGATTTQITEDATNAGAPAISGSNLVWFVQDGSVDNDTEIYFWDGATITQITDNSTGDWNPAISGSNVVWECDGDNDYYYEICLWDGVTTTQITHNDTEDQWPAISGSNVVWHGCDGGTGFDCTGGDWEIYMTTISNPVPSISFGGLALLASLVLGVVAWARRGS